MKDSSIAPFVAGSLAICSSVALNAQNPGAVEQAQQNNLRRQTQQSLLEPFGGAETAPELFPGENADVGPQSILKIKPRRRYVDLLADWQYFYTSNTYLQERGNGSSPVETGLMVSTIQLALAPDPYPLFGKPFSPRIGFRHQWYNYGLEDSSRILPRLDFDAQTVFTDLRYNVSKTWRVEAGLDWNRLLTHWPSSSDYTEFYREWAPRWGVTKWFPVNDKIFVNASYQGIYHFANSDPPINTSSRASNDRLDNILTVSYIHAFGQHFVAQPFYRFMVTEYTHAQRSRTDQLHTLGFQAGWFFNDKLSVRAFISWDAKESSDPIQPDYRKLDVGGGINFNYRF